MTDPARVPARLPPAGLPGLDPAWSRLVTVEREGETATWHVLDSDAAATSPVTLLCVHGNPSWSYLFRRLLAQPPAGSRVVAIDQLEMGFSERTGRRRRLADRIDDLDGLTEALQLDGEVVVVAHDWGGPVSLGWAQRHLDRLAGVVLMNTAVHQPASSAPPGLIRLVRSPRMLRRVTRDTSAFVRGAAALSRPRIDRSTRAALRAPYVHADRRAGIEQFVADIPLEADHPTAATLDRVADQMSALSDTPVLLLWGGADPVFREEHLLDLQARLPHAAVHRFPTAGHFVSEDVDVVAPIDLWLHAPTSPQPARRAVRSDAGDPDTGGPWPSFEHADSAAPAVVELGDGHQHAVGFADLDHRVTAAAARLVDAGLGPGSRIGLMVPPGVDLTIATYAVWRAGCVAVLIDAGLGVSGMSRAARGARLDAVVGIPRALAAARALRWCERRLPVSDVVAAGSTPQLDSRGLGRDDEAALVFTSGATGPSKGVRYTRRQVELQIDAVRSLYSIEPEDRLVAAFAPFALYGPALGVTSMVPEMDVSKPSSLTAGALADSIAAIDATLVFASPAALVNVSSTAEQLTPRQQEVCGRIRLLMSAGAPVPLPVLERAAVLFPNARIHTPYGMTEVLPVADIDLDELRRAGRGPGVCVGRPVPGVEVGIAPLDRLGVAAQRPDLTPEVLGEVLVKAGHLRDGYDRLWHTDRQASTPAGWHRSGDVGQLDPHGRLWIGGRIGHVVVTEKGPVAPVELEHRVQELLSVGRVAVVGVGPRGTQQTVVVIEDGAGRRLAALDMASTDAVRDAAAHLGLDVAAAFSIGSLPVDRRHNSKIDRSRVAAVVSRALSGSGGVRR